MSLVLIVDDSKTTRAYCRAILLSAGHEVMEAVDAEQALDRMADQPPDCVVLDLLMPGLSGIEMMEVLGARAFVNKPVSCEELTRAVRDAVTTGGSLFATARD